MIKIFLLAVLIISVDIYPQPKINSESFFDNNYKIKIKIDTEDFNLIDKGSKKIIRFNNYIDESKPGEFILPMKDLFIAIPFNSAPDIILSILKSNTIQAIPEFNPEVMYDKKSNFLGYSESMEFKGSARNNFYELKGFLWIGNNYCAHISINTYWFDHLKRTTNEIVDLELNFNFNKQITLNTSQSIAPVDEIILNKDFAKQVQHKPEFKIEADDSWIDYTKTYLKIGTAKDAIYRLTQGDIQNAEINIATLDPRSFKLIKNGIEIPIYVEGESDGNFDINDFIEFAGITNMGGKHREVNAFEEPYTEYFGRYSDTTIYWLTWNGEDGSRVELSDGSSASIASDTLEYYNEIIHIERNNWFDFSMQSQVKRELPFWIGSKTWMEGNLNVGTRNVPFTASDIYPNKPVKIFTKLQDFASNISQNAHLLSLKLNSDPASYDSGYINKYELKVLSGESNSGYLINGSNTLKVISSPTSASINTCIVDWYEIEYPRYLRAINDSLIFSFPYLTSLDFRTIKLSNVLSDNLAIWKYGERYKKYVAARNGNEIFINDSIASNDKFILTEENKILKPFIYYKKDFTDLHDPQNAADYLTITHKNFISNASEYSEFISSSYNLKVKLIDVDDIYDQFAYGNFNPESIKEFLKSTHTYWQNPSPKYVFLIGAATYDYHHNKTKFLAEQPTYNYVPSFGASVSDNWFVTWDTTGAYIPQMNIGRLPINSIDELNSYLLKHTAYVQQEYDDWNKRFLFFSGGKGNNQSELDQLRAVNEHIINNYTGPAPIGGINNHFYKTVNPQTNFGPYTPQEFQQAINDGGIFISYIGHSGTQTWDNSIIDPSQLKNQRNRYSLISDFGCSTARFAEPDVVSFSQLFVSDNDGQAISYIGNSSLGFISTSTTVPQIFYKKIVKDSIYQVSEALKQAKLELLLNFGSSEVNQLFTLTNTLIGDPVISLPIPSKPDLSISSADIEINPSLPADNLDSLSVEINFYNYGLVSNDSVIINIEDLFADSIIFSVALKEKVPLLDKQLVINIPIMGKAGEHQLRVKLDAGNSIDEISENNNEATLSFNIASSSLRSNLVYIHENLVDYSIIILHPSLKPLQEIIDVQFSDDPNFNTALSLFLPADSFYTKIGLSSLAEDKRYWMRARIKGENIYGIEKSFYNGFSEGYQINDSVSFSNTSLQNLKYSDGSIKLDTNKIVFSALSAGFNDGKAVVISKNSQNFIPENTLRGHHICLFRKDNFEFVEYKIFDLLGGGTTATNNYINFIDTLTNDYLVLIAVSDEGRVSSAALRNKIKELGSVFIDSLPFRGSWAIIGMKGAVPGTVPEAFSKPNDGRVQIDTTIYLPSTQGSLVSSTIGPAASWEEFRIKYNLPDNSEIKIKPSAIKTDGTIDTLDYFSLVDSTGDISSIDAKEFPYLKLMVELSKADSGDSPGLEALTVLYKSIPELGTNYQVVSVSADSIIQGGTIELDFSVYNVGESAADSFFVKAEVELHDNSSRLIMDSLITSLNPFDKKNFHLNYLSNSTDGKGNLSFRVSIDSENRITELYKDNNVFEIPFFVKPDTTVTSVSFATMEAVFDGKDIFDGDYISPTPEIIMSLNYPSWFPINDTTAVEFYLNTKQVFYSDFILDHDSANRRLIYNYKPALTDGEHTLRIFGRNLNGVMETSPGFQKMFLVSNQAQLLEVYNYPNPFKENTSFTFRLTQIPDELKIKIYSIAGRLLKQITKTPSELNINFNNILWDGRDEDGDAIANGVYLYKIIMKKGSDILDITEKLARIR